MSSMTLRSWTSTRRQLACQSWLSGHSHKPLITYRDGVLYLNPGSAGPRRFRLPTSVAELALEARTVLPRIVELAHDAPIRRE
jgi:predicted phosphodiesterase